MKFTTLFSLAATVAQVQAVNILCNFMEDGTTCEQFRQYSVCDGFVNANRCCDPDQSIPKLFQIKSTVCNDDREDYGDSSVLTLSGPALSATSVTFLDMTLLNDGENCEDKTYDFDVDVCKESFSAQFSQTNLEVEQNNSRVSKNFMKRNCPLDTSIECSIVENNIEKTCASFAEDYLSRNPTDRSCAAVTLNYEYCATSTFTEHNVKLRRDRDNCDSNGNPNACKESYININGVYSEDPIAENPSTGRFWKVGYSNRNGQTPYENCFTVSSSFDPCSPEIPNSYMNLVGEVKNAYNSDGIVPADADLKDEYKACFKSAKFEKIILDTNDTSNQGSANGNSEVPDCDENPTAAPSAAPSSAAPSSPSKGKGKGKGKKCKAKAKAPKRVRARY